MSIKIFILNILLFFSQEIQQNSNEFYDCVNPDKNVKSSSECTSIKINESEGYECCSMKITFNNISSYNCFALETNYTQNKEIFEAFATNKNIYSLFGSTGGLIEIKCREDLISEQNYQKISDEFLNCYNSNIKQVNDENDCYIYDIPQKEESKCCYIETLYKDKSGNYTKEKRCYIIQDIYFTKEKNLNNYLLDKSNLKSLEQINNTNITIKCKNYEPFYFTSKFDDYNINTISNPKEDDNDNNNSTIIEINPNKEKDKKISNTGIIVAIIIIVVVVLIGTGIFIFYFFKKKKENLKKSGIVNINNKISNKEIKKKNIKDKNEYNNINTNNKINDDGLNTIIENENNKNNINSNNANNKMIK